MVAFVAGENLTFKMTANTMMKEGKRIPGKLI
jgi:hypothetical protein